MTHFVCADGAKVREWMVGGHGFRGKDDSRPGKVCFHFILGPFCLSCFLSLFLLSTNDRSQSIRLLPQMKHKSLSREP